jgi:hypothetical protein
MMWCSGGRKHSGSDGAGCSWDDGTAYSVPLGLDAGGLIRVPASSRRPPRSRPSSTHLRSSGSAASFAQEQGGLDNIRFGARP